MAVKSRFLIVKEKKLKDTKYFDNSKIGGYNLTMKKGVHFADAIDINRVMIVNPVFIDKIASEKINSKFNKLINMMQIVCEVGDEDETGEGYKIALDEAGKLKMELYNKYKKYISDQKLDLMIKKIEILEDELKLRLDLLLNENILNEEIEKGHSK